MGGGDSSFYFYQTILFAKKSFGRQFLNALYECIFETEKFCLLSDGDARQIDLDPMMLTILGVVAGVLIVIIIVTLAIRIHASRSRGRLRTRASSDVGNGNPSGNKVVVTTIEGNYSLYAKMSKKRKN